MKSDPLRHYHRHESEYDQIANTLDRVRETFVSAELAEQKAMLFDSSVFAVVSVQNSISILRKAFRGYAQSENLAEVRDVMKGVNYGNNKFEYIEHNRDVIMSDVGTEICKALEREMTWQAMDEIVENLKGVSWIKSAFIPAMLGFQDTMCIDTNIEQMVPDDSVQSSGYKNADSYSCAVLRVEDEFPTLSREVSRFMLQWIVFDTNRNDGVARHEEWFEHILPGSPFGRQAVLGEY